MGRLVSSLTVLILVLGSPVATAQEGTEPAPTAVHDLSAVAEGSAVSVAAHVAFGGQAPVVLGTDPTGDAPPNGTGHGAGAGLDLTEIRAYQADPAVPSVTFEWQATALDQLPPPEVVRYYWQFTVGAAVFAVQAKTTDIVSAANAGDGEPETIANNLASYAGSSVPSFRVRGNCALIELVVTGLNNCGHVAWVAGEFDVAADVIRLHLPLDLAAAPTLRPGAIIAPEDTGAYSAIQAAADFGQTRDTVVQASPYAVPKPRATATLVAADGTLVDTGQLSLDDDGMWRGTLTAPAAGSYRVDLDACFATNCGVAQTAVAVG